MLKMGSSDVDIFSVGHIAYDVKLVDFVFVLVSLRGGRTEREHK